VTNAANQATDTPLASTPLNDLHVRLGARMVPFAGYSMPVQYPTGIIAEHQWTRASAGLFDVSHMGQVTLTGADIDARLERLVPGDIKDLGQGKLRYTQLLDPAGGILDDLMVTRRAGDLFLVVNAGNKLADVAHMKRHLGEADVTYHGTRALLALQGPQAAAALGRLAPEAPQLAFMTAAAIKVAGVEAWVSRSGYTGEDGFEIAIAGTDAMTVATQLLADPAVKPIGLGARDSLRLEAGLPLHGHDIDTTTSPIEAGLAFSIARRRREEGGFPGAERIQRELRDGPARRLVGLKPEGRAPVRDGTEIRDLQGRVIGKVTSGGFGPTAGGPIAIGYVETAFAAPDTKVTLELRGKPVGATIAKMPFVPKRYAKA
jgi:aminomethyltransferase